MGTSNAFSGQSGRTPLIPSWLNDEGDSLTGNQNGGETGDSSQSEPSPNSPPNGLSPSSTQVQPSSPHLPLIANPTRFTGPRKNFTRFVKSGGKDSKSLGRAISQYVSSATGGARSAATRMGASRNVGSKLFDFLSSVVARGETDALGELKLGELAGRPLREISPALIDTLCPDGGSKDEGIARAALDEAIMDFCTALDEEGIASLEGLNEDQLYILFELFILHSIEYRLLNDIGNSIIDLPKNIQELDYIQSQLRDFISGAVSDAISLANKKLASLTAARIGQFVIDIYSQAFIFLKTMGEAAMEEA